MGRPGRKRKDGPRYPNGRLKVTPARDRGCEGVQRRRALYAAAPLVVKDESGEPQIVRPADGSQTFDAIGRAWSAGLLGYRADELRDGARKIAAQYWRVYGFPTPDSLARFQPCEGVGLMDSDREKLIEQALNDALEEVRKCGHDVRRAFNALVIDMNPDHGPEWLDRIIFAKRRGCQIGDRDGDMLRLALIGLEAVA